jgi:DNA-binding Lrp family transcriptional regulator
MLTNGHIGINHLFILGQERNSFSMQTKIPKIFEQINKEDIYNVLDKKYSILGSMWVSHQIEWFNGNYACFKDHDKFLIIIYLTKKTLDFYLSNFIKLTYWEFFSNENIEIEEFNISEISNELYIPKESARRKIIELESEGVIRKIGKKIIIDRSCFNYSKPIDSIKRVSTFLSTLSTMAYEEKILPRKLTSSELELIIKNNFSNIWNFYYELQIPMMINYKKIFKDFDSFHIFGICVVGQHFDAKKLSTQQIDRDDFMKSFFTNAKPQGINAMSISEITGIPRATVIRKLQKLVKQGNLTIDKMKHYRLKGTFLKSIKPIQKDNLFRLSNFSAKIYNLAL